MSILFWIFLGIAFDVAILLLLKAATGKQDKMSYCDYLRDYGSVADSNPELYSDYNDYM